MADKISKLANEVLDDGDDLIVTPSFQPMEDSSSLAGNMSVIDIKKKSPLGFTNRNQARRNHHLDELDSSDSDSEGEGHKKGEKQPTKTTYRAKIFGWIHPRKKRSLPNSNPQNGKATRTVPYVVDEDDENDLGPAPTRQQQVQQQQLKQPLLSKTPRQSITPRPPTSRLSVRSTRYDVSNERSLLVRQNAQVVGRASMAESSWDVDSLDSSEFSIGSLNIVPKRHASQVSVLTDAFSIRSSVPQDQMMYLTPPSILGSEADFFSVQEEDEEDEDDANRKEGDDDYMYGLSPVHELSTSRPGGKLPTGNRPFFSPAARMETTLQDVVEEDDEYETSRHSRLQPRLSDSAVASPELSVKTLGEDDMLDPNVSGGSLNFNGSMRSTRSTGVNNASNRSTRTTGNNNSARSARSTTLNDSNGRLSSGINNTNNRSNGNKDSTRSNRSTVINNGSTRSNRTAAANNNNSLRSHRSAYYPPDPLWVESPERAQVARVVSDSVAMTERRQQQMMEGKLQQPITYAKPKPIHSPRQVSDSVALSSQRRQRAGDFQDSYSSISSHSRSNATLSPVRTRHEPIPHQDQAVKAKAFGDFRAASSHSGYRKMHPTTPAMITSRQVSDSVAMKDHRIHQVSNQHDHQQQYVRFHNSYDQHPAKYGRPLLAIMPHSPRQVSDSAAEFERRRLDMKSAPTTSRTQDAYPATIGIPNASEKRPKIPDSVSFSEKTREFRNGPSGARPSTSASNRQVSDSGALCEQRRQQVAGERNQVSQCSNSDQYGKSFAAARPKALQNLRMVSDALEKSNAAVSPSPREDRASVDRPPVPGVFSKNNSQKILFGSDTSHLNLYRPAARTGEHSPSDAAVTAAWLSPTNAINRKQIIETGGESAVQRWQKRCEERFHAAYVASSMSSSDTNTFTVKDQVAHSKSGTSGEGKLQGRVAQASIESATRTDLAAVTVMAMTEVSSRIQPASSRMGLAGVTKPPSLANTEKSLEAKEPIRLRRHHDGRPNKQEEQNGYKNAPSQLHGTTEGSVAASKTGETGAEVSDCKPSSGTYWPQQDETQKRIAQGRNRDWQQGPVESKWKIKGRSNDSLTRLSFQDSRGSINDEQVPLRTRIFSDSDVKDILDGLPNEDPSSVEWCGRSRKLSDSELTASSGAILNRPSANSRHANVAGFKIQRPRKLSDSEGSIYSTSLHSIGKNAHATFDKLMASDSEITISSGNSNVFPRRCSDIVESPQQQRLHEQQSRRARTCSDSEITIETTSPRSRRATTRTICDDSNPPFAGGDEAQLMTELPSPDALSAAKWIASTLATSCSIMDTQKKINSKSHDYYWNDKSDDEQEECPSRDTVLWAESSDSLQILS